MDAALDAVVCLDEAGRVLGWNPMAAHLLGWARKEAIGREAWELLAPPGVAPVLQADVGRLLVDPSSGPYRLERNVVARGGAHITAELTIAASRINGQLFVTLFLRDVTDRRRAERLREVEHRLARVLAAARTGREITRGVLELLGTGLGFDDAELWLADVNDGTLRMTAAWRRRPGNAFGATGRRLVLGRGEDLAGMAWEIGEAVCIDDAQAVEGLVRADSIATEGIHGAAAVPLHAAGRLVGVGVMARRAPEHLDPELRQTLHAIGVQIGHFAERRASERRLAEETIALAAVSRATRRLTDAVDNATARKAICRAALDVSGAAYAFVALPDAEHGGLTVRAACPEEADTRWADHFPQDTPSAAIRAFSTGNAVFIADTSEQTDIDAEQARRAGVVSGLIQPIMRDDQALGVLGVGWTTPQATLDRSTRMLVRMLADEAAMALSRVELVSRLEAAARTDPLTGLANVRAWQEHLTRELASAARDGRSVTVALLDLDGFKALNDQFGHLRGDRVLRTSAAAWQAQLRRGDLLARLGGDEFAALLPSCDADHALVLADRLRGATQEITSSIGIAHWDGDEPMSELMERADSALYAAKAAGRDQVAVR